MRQFRARYRARQLTLDLVKCLARPDRFRISQSSVVTRVVITHGTTSVRIQPGRFRCFDRVMVEYKGADVWLPLLSRLRLRQVVRCVLAEAAQEGIYGDQG